MGNQAAVAKLVAIATISALIALTGCTKKRAEKIAPGQGDNLQTVSEFSNKVFKLKTLNAVDKAEVLNVTKSKNTDYKSPKYGLDNFSIVNYDTEPKAELLGSTKIVARPNSQDSYEIHYVVTNDYVKVMKVAKEADIPLQERTFAETLADGRKAVPLVGYKIQGKYILDNIQNELGQKSSLLREKAVTNISQATHLRIDLSSPEIFKAVQKPDLLPVSYFEGEWYFAETVVQAPEDKKDQEGFISESGIGSSTRIKFVKNKDNFEAVSLNLDERLKKQSDINFARVFSLPVEWKEFRSVEAGNGTGMREEENNEIAFDKKSYVLVNFERVVSKMDDGSLERTLQRALGANSEGAKLVNIEIQDNYLSFTLEKNESNVRFKMSLRRVEKSNYDPKLHFEDDWQKFGFFTTTKSSVMNYEIHRKEDLEKNVFISRFNPKAGKIEFRFTKTTPAWLRPAVRKAIISWDDSFCRASNGIASAACDQVNKCKIGKIDTDKNNESCQALAQKTNYLQVTLNEKDGDVELGDLRYNIINLIESESESNLFGYGPSLTDPYTGEIISATTNVHVTPIRSALIDEVRNYVLMKLGYLNEVRLGGGIDVLTKIDGKNSSLVVNSSSYGQLKTLKLPTQILKYADSKIKAKFATQDKTFNLDFTRGNSPYGREYDLSLTSKNIHREIETMCPEIAAYISDLKTSKITHNSNELASLDKCSRKLVIDKMAGTLIHEIGHNLGLRHNFTASNDVANFWPAAKDQLVRSSSVMEYPAFNEDRLTKPGLYDIAALQYGYADRVTDIDGNVVPLKTHMTIEKNLGSKSLKPFKFCTDEHAFWGTDPMCRRHDAGITPLEVVETMVRDYRTEYALYNYRYDRAGIRSGLGLALSRMFRYYIPLKHIHEKWRIILADYIGRDKMYLEGMDEAQYEAAVKKLMVDPNVSAESKSYQAASEKAFDFLLSVAGLSNQYCLVQNSIGAFDIVEFDKIRDDSFSAGKNKLKSCRDADSADWFKKNSLNVITELGYPLNDVKFDLRPEKATEPNDIAGNGADRMMALQAITARISLSLRGAQIGLSANFLDVPKHRNQLISIALSRVGQGVSVESLESVLAQSMKKEEIDIVKKSKQFFKKFEAEKDVIEMQLGYLIQGLIIPGKDQENVDRLREFRVLRSNSQADIKQAQESGEYIVIPLNTSALVISKQTKNMAAIASMYMNAQAMKNFKDISPEMNQLFTKAIQSLKLPANAEVASKISANDYAKGFESFAAAFAGIKEAQQEELKMLLSFYPEIMGAVQIITQLNSIEEQATLTTIEDFAKKMKERLKAGNPKATDAEVDQAVNAQLEQYSSMGMNAETIKKAGEKARQQLEQVKKQLSESAAKVIGKQMLTQDIMKNYLEAKKIEIASKAAEAKSNRKDYEAQMTLIIGFLTSLSNQM